MTRSNNSCLFLSLAAAPVAVASAAALEKKEEKEMFFLASWKWLKNREEARAGAEISVIRKTSSTEKSDIPYSYLPVHAASYTYGRCLATRLSIFLRSYLLVPGTKLAQYR